MKTIDIKTEYLRLKQIKEKTEKGLDEINEYAVNKENEIEEKLKDVLPNVIIIGHQHRMDDIEVYGLIAEKGPSVAFELDSLKLVYHYGEIEIRPCSSMSPSMEITDVLIAKLKTVIEETIADS